MDPELQIPANEHQSGATPPPREPATIEPQAAVSDLSNGHEISPEDGTTADVSRDADDELVRTGDMDVRCEYPIKAGECSPYANESDTKSHTSDVDSLQPLKGNSEDIRPVKNYVVHDDRDSMTAYAAGGVPAEMVKTDANMISNVEPGEILKMFEVASSLNEKGPGFDTVGEESRLGMENLEMAHEMVKMASDGVSQMTSEEFHNMLSLLNMNDPSSPVATSSKAISGSSVAAGSSATGNPNAGECNFNDLLLDSGMDQSSPSIPTSAVNLQDAHFGLSRAQEVSLEDETAADVLRDANDIPGKRDGDQNVPQPIKDLDKEVNQSVATYFNGSPSSTKYPFAQPNEAGQCSRSASESCLKAPISDAECLQSLGDKTKAIRFSQNDVFNGDPDSLAALSTGGISAELIKTATDMISTTEPEELQKMLEAAFSLNVKGPMFNTIGNRSRLGFEFPDITLDMVKMASDKVGKMTPEELQKMLEVAPLVNMNVIFSPRPATQSITQRSKSCTELSDPGGISAMGKPDTEVNYSPGLHFNSKTNESSSSLPTSTTDFPDNLPNDPATQQMFAYMMKDMSPEIMTSMSEQLGLKLPSDEVAKAQQAMSSISEDDEDIMIQQGERVQGSETMEKTTIWFLGKAGLNLAICMMIFAFLLHKLGYMRG